MYCTIDSTCRILVNIRNAKYFCKEAIFGSSLENLRAKQAGGIGAWDWRILIFCWCLLNGILCLFVECLPKLLVYSICQQHFSFFNHIMSSRLVFNTDLLSVVEHHTLICIKKTTVHWLHYELCVHFQILVKTGFPFFF